MLKINKLFLICFYIFGFQFAGAQECETLKNTAPRGLDCLYCTHPNADKSTDGITKALLNSCIQNVSLGFLLDGSFGSNFEKIYEMSKTITDQGRTLWLHLYLLSGPAQRRWDDNIFPDAVFLMEPSKFRAKISKDLKFQNKYISFVKSFSGLFAELNNLGVKISISPMLEDNLDDASFLKILELTQASIDIQVRYIRSTCRDCYLRNGKTIPLGVGREDHRSDAVFNYSNGVFSNDGWGFVRFKNDKLIIKRPIQHSDGRKEKVMTLSGLREALLRANRLNNIFLLWIPKYQNTLPGDGSLNPNQRKYPVPKKSEIDELSKFLSGKRI